MTATSPSDRDARSELAAALSRRSFLKGASSAAAGGLLTRGLLADVDPSTLDEHDVETLAGTIELELMINGAKQRVRVEPRTTLLNALRNHCTPPLTGTKLVCDRGNCGACTVHIDGEPAYACLLLAADQRGRAIRTIEGLGAPEKLSPVQAAFWKADASMCGFCTPGFVMSISACLAKNPQAGLDEIKQSCSGNLCRCGTYPHIFDAARALQGEGDAANSERKSGEAR